MTVWILLRAVWFAFFVKAGMQYASPSSRFKRPHPVKTQTSSLDLFEVWNKTDHIFSVDYGPCFIFLLFTRRKESIILTCNFQSFQNRLKKGTSSLFVFSGFTQNSVSGCNFFCVCACGYFPPLVKETSLSVLSHRKRSSCQGVRMKQVLHEKLLISKQRKKQNQQALKKKVPNTE